MPKSFSWDNVSVTFNGMELNPESITTSREEYRKVTSFDITGFITDEQLLGGEDMAFERQGTTLGSYGYAVKCLAEGLTQAVNEGFITDAEAKEEFRSHINVVKEKDNREAYIKHLEDQIENLKSGKPTLMPGVIDQRLT